MGASEWLAGRLGDVCQIVPGYAFKSTDWTDQGIPVVKIKNITGNGSVEMADADCVPESLLTPKLQKFILKDRDVLVAMTGATAGKVGRVRTDRPIFLNQRVAKIEPVTADRDFIWSVVSSEEYQEKFFYLADGAAQPNMSGGQIERVEIPLPPLPVQRRIAGILSAYDELMENCQRRIRILEEIARSLYREWFVLFRFPGHEGVPRINSPVGPIPRGWEVKRLGELAEHMRRNVPKGRLEEPQPYVGLEHIPRRSLALDAWETATDLGSNKLEFKKGEVLFGQIRPYFHKVSVAPFDGLCSADTFVIRARSSAHYASVVACVSSDEFVAHATATSNGSKMPRAKWDVLEEYKVVIPPSETAGHFSRLMCNVIAQQQTLIFKIQNLRRTRDLLLSRLLSGQVPLDISEDVAELTTSAPLLSETDFASDEQLFRAAEEAPPWPVERAGNGHHSTAEPADETPVPIQYTERTDVLQIIRQVFSEGPPRPREDAIRDVARALGYRRTGEKIREVLHADLLTAVRRGILENTDGTLRLCARSITDIDRDFLKQQFLAAIGRPWIDRDTAIRDFCRWLGFARTGPIIEDTTRSLINGLLREGRLEADGAELIRRT